MGSRTWGYVTSAIPNENWQDLAEDFRRLEDGGADAIWFTDHLFAGHSSGEPFVLAGVAATVTDHCAIGTGILQLPLRRPAAVAKAASTLQQVSGNRFRLGVGVGQHRDEFDLAGIEFRTRGDRANSALRQLRHFWVPSDDWFAMRPNTPAPIWVAGHSEAALERTVAFGDGWLPLFISPGRYAGTNAVLDEKLRAAGRPPEAVARHVLLVVGPTDSTWTAEDAIGIVVRLFPEPHKGLDRHLIVGDMESCVERIGAFEEAGAAGIELLVLHREPVDAFLALRAELAKRT